MRSWLRALYRALLRGVEPYAPEYAEAPSVEQVAKAILTPDCPSIDDWAGIVEPAELKEIDVEALEAFYLTTHQAKED